MRRVSRNDPQFERIAIYGDPKTGKTRLATALPWGPYWGDRAVYVAQDPSSEFVRSVLRPDRDHLEIVKPERNKRGEVLEDLVEIARHPWSDEGYKTLIWDTMSETSRILLQEYANTGVFTESHAAEMGKRGTPSWHTAPAPGDYGAAQNSIMFLLTHLWDQPMHLIVLWHAKWVEPKQGSPDGLVGGPDVSGGAMVRLVAGKFDACFRTDLAMDPKTRQGRILVHTTQRGIWKAGFRTDRPRQGMPTTVPLGEEPREFWEAYMADLGLSNSTDAKEVKSNVQKADPERS